MERQDDSELIGKLKSFHEKDRSIRQQLTVLMETLNEVNQKLKESEALKTNFLSNIRNEINNPLTSIMGLSEEIIKGSDREGGSLQHIAGMIYSEAFNLDFQLRNIFVAAELEAGESIPCISNVDMTALIQSTINSFQHKAERKKITVLYTYRPVNESGEKKLFKTDPGKLKLILSNLLCNAIEFSFQGGWVQLEAKEDGGHLVFALRDYGIGFDMKDEKTIFERFRQLDTGTTRKYGGHGLGLSIAKDLVEILGGTISVESAKERGSVFTVTVPEAETVGEVDIFSDDGNVFVF